MKEMILSRSLDLLLILISTALGYFFGRLSERSSSKLRKLEEKLRSLYWRFEHTLLKKTNGAFLFSDLDAELQDEFFGILIDGYCYADSKLKLKITEFRWQWISNDIDSLNDTFFDISKDIFEYGDKLSNKLYRSSLKCKLR